MESYTLQKIGRYQRSVVISTYKDDPSRVAYSARDHAIRDLRTMLKTGQDFRLYGPNGERIRP